MRGLVSMSLQVKALLIPPRVLISVWTFFFSLVYVTHLYSGCKPVIHWRGCWRCTGASDKALNAKWRLLTQNFKQLWQKEVGLKKFKEHSFFINLSFRRCHLFSRSLSRGLPLLASQISPCLGSAGTLIIHQFCFNIFMKSGSSGAASWSPWAPETLNPH